MRTEAPPFFIEHLCTGVTRWDSLAWQYYGNAAAFGGIVAANPQLDISDTIAAGQLVFIPVLAAGQAEVLPQDLPPWKR